MSYELWLWLHSSCLTSGHKSGKSTSFWHLELFHHCIAKRNMKHIRCRAYERFSKNDDDDDDDDKDGVLVDCLFYGDTHWICTKDSFWNFSGGLGRFRSLMLSKRMTFQMDSFNVKIFSLLLPHSFPYLIKYNDNIFNDNNINLPQVWSAHKERER